MLQLSGLTYRLGERLLIDDATVSLPPGGRIGLVGRNGTGKTTLFRLIRGEIAAEAGRISLPKGVRIGGVAQEAPAGPEALIEIVLAADTERAALMTEAETATDPHRIAEIQTRLVDINAHAAPARAAAILHGLGFDAAAQVRPASDFSGGWRMRVALAAVLFAAPDLLLLDEPTNYLDIEGALWLQDYLARYPHTIVMVSHDRDVLDAVCDHILHLEYAKLRLWRGDYSNFERQYAADAELEAKEAQKLEAERKHLQSFIDRFKAKASKATQAQSRVKRLEKLGQATVRRRIVDPPIRLPSPEKPLSPPIIRLDRAAVGYGDHPVLKGLTLSISNDDRIGLLGANGNGKSTFVKLIADRLKPMGGEIVRAPKIDIAFFAQHQLDELDADATPALLVRRKMPQAGEAQVRSRAAQIGFGEAKADTPVTRLSGGEKARLLLGLAAFEGPHLLILDEPTNHLDIPARDALVEAIAAYKGAVIIVSHDRFLLDATCDRLWLVKDGRVQPFEGDIDDYAKLVLAGDAAPTSGKTDVSTTLTETSAPPVKRREAGHLKREIGKAEAEMARLSELIRRVDAALAAPDAFQRDPVKAGKLAADRGALADKLARIEEQWLTLSGELEGAG